MTPVVLDEYETIRRVRDERLSLARYGDGEIKLCRGADCKPQDHDHEIAKRLRNILISDAAHTLVAVPNIWSGVVPAAKTIWRAYREGANAQFYKPGKVYGSSFVSRPDSAPHINTDSYWGLMRSIWVGRDVVFLTGAKKGRQFLHTGMLSNARNLAVVHGPQHNAWGHYRDLMERVRSKVEGLVDPLVILALGPTATVMAYHLGKEGIQALDLGHAGVFYRNWLEQVTAS